MPRPEWSFFMPAEDHLRLKWFFSFLRAKFTVWGQMIFGLVLLGMAVSSVGTQISAYYFVSLVWALFLTSLLMQLFFKPTVSATRSLMPSPTAGGVYAYRLTMTNNGRRPLRNLEIFLHKLPYGLYDPPGPPEQKNFVEWLDPGRQITLVITLRTPRRGSYILEPLIVGTSFPSGLMRSLKTVAGRDPLIVFPKLLKVSDPDLFLSRLSSTEDAGTLISLGGSNEFLSTREYRDGDRPRDVHWNSSARAGKLIVKEYSHEHLLRVGLFLDAELKRFEKHLCFEARIALCAGMAEDFLKMHYGVQLFLSNASPAVSIRGEKNGFAYLLEMLSEIEGINQVNFSNPLLGIGQHRAGMSSLVLFLKDWDHQRASFVKAIKELSIPVKIIIIRDKPLSLSVDDPSVAVYTPKQLGFQL